MASSDRAELDLDEAVRRALDEVAPDIDAATVDADADFHDELGLDSMDTLNFAIALFEITGIDVPERDYPRIDTVARCVEYLRARSTPR